MGNQWEFNGHQWQSSGNQVQQPIIVYRRMHLEPSHSFNNYMVPLHLNATPSEVGLEVHNSIGQLVVCNWAVKYGMTGV